MALILVGTSLPVLVLAVMLGGGCADEGPGDLPGLDDPSDVPGPADAPGGGDPDLPADPVADPVEDLPAEDCFDNVDNDGNEFVDCYDPACGCEPEVCGDDVDNDGDGLVDFDDPECDGAVEVCDDDIDNDGDEFVDCQDPDCDCEPEVCWDEVDNNGDGLVDCTATPDPECPCDMLGEGCRASERVAFVHCPSVGAVELLPSDRAVDVFTCEEVFAAPHLLNPYDTIAYYGPMNDAAYRGLNLLFRSGRKVIIFANRGNEAGWGSTDWLVGSGGYWDLQPHFHRNSLDGASISVSETNTMSGAFDQRRYPGFTLVQMNTSSASWCGDLFFSSGGYNGHFHGYLRDTAVERGALFFVGLYSPSSDVIGFSDPFVAANLDQMWNPGTGTSEACGLTCTRGVGWGVGKPVIYLYPEEEQAVTVRLDFDGELVTTYPPIDEEIGGWQVIASPDGTLVDVRDGAEYGSIFWNGVTADFEPDFSEGFVVRGADTVTFLQATLSEIGLEPHEYNELIVYWLPYMEHHAYNLIHFAGSEYTDIARMRINPEPDSLLRVFMVFRELEDPISIPAQSFEPFERRGFTVVEWGGSEIGGDWHVVR